MSGPLCSGGTVSSLEVGYTSQTAVGVGNRSSDSDLQQPAVMSPLGEEDWW